jgi:hypothetical protein
MYGINHSYVFDSAVNLTIRSCIRNEDRRFRYIFIGSKNRLVIGDKTLRSYQVLVLLCKELVIITTDLTLHMVVVLRCPHCFHEFTELTLKLRDLKEHRQEAEMMRIKETCPDCNSTSTLTDMHHKWKPDSEKLHGTKDS